MKTIVNEKEIGTKHISLYHTTFKKKKRRDIKYLQKTIY